MTGINIDITSRKEAEQAQRRLAAIVESSDDAIVGKDLNGIVTSWNPGAERDVWLLGEGDDWTADYHNHSAGAARG